MNIGDFLLKAYPAQAFGMDEFPRAMCLYAAANETGRQTYRKAGNHIRSRIEKRVRLGGINFAHQLLILNAEDALFRKNDLGAKELYRQAIVAAARAGFIQDVGLANERCARLFLRRHEAEEGLHHVKEAIRFYSEWGASRKVKLLKEKYSNLLAGDCK